MPRKLIVTALLSTFLATIAWCANGFLATIHAIKDANKEYYKSNDDIIEKSRKRCVFLKAYANTWDRSMKRFKDFSSTDLNSFYSEEGTSKEPSGVPLIKSFIVNSLTDMGAIDGFSGIDFGFASDLRADLAQMLAQEHTFWVRLDTNWSKRRSNKIEYDKDAATIEIDEAMNEYYRLSHAVSSRKEFWSDQLVEINRQIDQRNLEHADTIAEIKIERWFYSTVAFMCLAGASVIVATALRADKNSKTHTVDA